MDFDSDEDVKHSELLRDIESLGKPDSEKDVKGKRNAAVEKVEIADLLRSVKSTRYVVDSEYPATSTA